MPSPITPDQFGEAIPSANADFCVRFSRWLNVPQLLRDLFSWMLTPDGAVSDTFKAEVATYSAPTGALMYTLTLNVGTGWLICDGREVSRTTYAALFNEIGTLYGDGDGSTTFNLPDGRGRSLIGAGQGAGLTSRDINTKYVGAETVSLTESQNGPHKHRSGFLTSLSQDVSNQSSILRDQTDKSLAVYGSTATAVGSGRIVGGIGNFSDRTEINVSENGSGAPHDNISPMIIAYLWIKV